MVGRIVQENLCYHHECGQLITGQAAVQQTGDRLYKLLIRPNVYVYCNVVSSGGCGMYDRSKEGYWSTGRT